MQKKKIELYLLVFKLFPFSRYNIFIKNFVKLKEVDFLLVRIIIIQRTSKTALII